MKHKTRLIVSLIALILALGGVSGGLAYVFLKPKPTPVINDIDYKVKNDLKKNYNYGDGDNVSLTITGVNNINDYNVSYKLVDNNIPYLQLLNNNLILSPGIEPGDYKYAIESTLQHKEDLKSSIVKIFDYGFNISNKYSDFTFTNTLQQQIEHGFDSEISGLIAITMNNGHDPYISTDSIVAVKPLFTVSGLSDYFSIDNTDLAHQKKIVIKPENDSSTKLAVGQYEYKIMITFMHDGVEEKIVENSYTFRVDPIDFEDFELTNTLSSSFDYNYGEQEVELSIPTSLPDATNIYYELIVKDTLAIYLSKDGDNKLKLSTNLPVGEYSYSVKVTLNNAPNYNTRSKTFNYNIKILAGDFADFELSIDSKSTESAAFTTLKEGYTGIGLTLANTCAIANTTFEYSIDEFYKNDKISINNTPSLQIKAGLTDGTYSTSVICKAINPSFNTKEVSLLYTIYVSKKNPKITYNSIPNGYAVSSSSKDGSDASLYAPANVFNENTTNDSTGRWDSASGQSDDAWILLKLPVLSKLASFRIMFGKTSGGGSASYHYTSYKIQGSNDGSIFSDVISSCTASASQTWYEYTNSNINNIASVASNTYLYYRFYGITAYNSTWGSIIEIEYYFVS